ncbi:hypothetical protein QVD17_32712 [Tagetes erecta]|uniref:EF-hand domain-containing protein n=1 Tax=Tagetes erecta TaxID=13708 RepID=A0AAD8K039_TARER|nr:hypothetical protein QVD17_32712 [Tagetes erecta]
MPKMACFRLTFFVFVIVIGAVKGRWLDQLEPYPTSSTLISDGVHDVSHENTNDYLRTSSSNSSLSTTTLYDEKRCESFYGFLPCADTMAEGVFLMFMYTYLMLQMEEWIGKGSQALFVLLGDYEVIGAGLFRVLMAFPRIVLVVGAGIFSSDEAAQNQVAFGLRMYAGSTLITLTLLWGFCIMLNNDKLRENEPLRHQEDSSTKCLSPLKDKLSILSDNGVNIDKETKEIAVMMLLSLIPFLTVELVPLIKSQVTALFALLVSILSLLSYFGYQILNPWIQHRTLAYLKEENLQIRFLYHIEKLANDKLIDNDGNPNLKEFERIFKIIDKNNDERISRDEVKTLFENVFDLEKDHISTEYAKVELFNHFDDNKSELINWPEFQNGCTKWLKKWKQDDANTSKISSNSGSKSIWKQVVEASIENKRKDLAHIQHIMSRILRHSVIKYELVNEDRLADREKIEGFFSQYDFDGDNKMNRDELKEFTKTLPFGVLLYDDAIFDKLAKDFCNDESVDTIGKNEFVQGFIKWINKVIKENPSTIDPKTAITKFDEELWAEIDTPPHMVKPKPRILYVVFGIPIMFLISGAFMQSITQFSNAAHIPFHLTSFVVFPIVMNIKMFIRPFLHARSHVSKNASLAFSEMYNGLVMNNLLGLLTLIAIVYAKGLSWTYSTEVFTIVIPCIVVGTFALKFNTYTLWASICAMLLYPIYICLYCVFGS